MRLERVIIKIVVAAVLSVFPASTRAETIDIDPVIQQASVWCWAATAEMVLKHFGFPSVNPVGNYQCGVVGSLGGVCNINCAACVGRGGPTTNLVPILNNYANIADPAQDFTPRHRGRLTKSQIITSIDDDSPVIAGISPSYQGVDFPDGLGMSEHVVVIVGYEDQEDGDLQLIVNDPFPYRYTGQPDPYLRNGAELIVDGQYRISYTSFVNSLRYRNSVVFN